MTSLNYSESVVIARPAEVVYDMNSDFTRMDEWGRVSKARWWDAGDVPGVGARFTGHDVSPERAWETRSGMVAAERGREFAFEVGVSWIRWSDTFAPV